MENPKEKKKINWKGVFFMCLLCVFIFLSIIDLANLVAIESSNWNNKVLFLAQVTAALIFYWAYQLLNIKVYKEVKNEPKR